MNIEDVIDNASANCGCPFRENAQAGVTASIYVVSKYKTREIQNIHIRIAATTSKTVGHATAKIKSSTVFPSSSSCIVSNHDGILLR